MFLESLFGPIQHLMHSILGCFKFFSHSFELDDIDRGNFSLVFITVCDRFYAYVIFVVRSDPKMVSSAHIVSSSKFFWIMLVGQLVFEELFFCLGPYGNDYPVKSIVQSLPSWTI